ATSASTACPNSVLAPLRKTSVSGSENVPGWVSSKTLVWVTAYHSFCGEVEALNTPRYAALPFHAVTNFRPSLAILEARAQRKPTKRLVSGRNIGCRFHVRFREYVSRARHRSKV